VIGAVVFSFCMGNINSLITSTDGVGKRFDDKMRILQARKPPLEISTFLIVTECPRV
jgi:hypothetical protein